MSLRAHFLLGSRPIFEWVAAAQSKDRVLHCKQE
jgi:hypothetical protein